MNRFVAAFGLLFALIGLPASALAQANHIERIEPANWWVGMKSDQLQLMVHGSGIAGYTPELAYSGVRIKSVQRVENPNYLFVNLVISSAARPGTLQLKFRQGNASFEVPYQLNARRPGSANRAGFTSADVILNLMPDRFANGNPANDTLPGFADGLNRASNEAGRHGGDIQGMIDHLDYIAAMGYTMIWPTPLTENNQTSYSYHGYAATDTYKIDARFGSNEDFKRMVQLARQKGVGVIQDIVLNHIGSEHWWMKDMPMKDWLSNDGSYVPTSNIHSSISDPYSSEADRLRFTAGWFTRNMPDMNQKNPYVATYQIQNAIWWVEYADLSGIRVDTYGYSDTAFLSEWSRRLTEEYPKLNIVGEEWSMNPAVVSYWQKGKVHANGYVSYLPSLMDFPLNDALRGALAEGEGQYTGLVKLYEALANDVQYPDPHNLVLFEGNHDLSRLYTVLNDDANLVRLALTYVATMPRIPQFYYGTEILMSSQKERNDGETRRDFPGGWNGDTINAFTGTGLSQAQLEMQSFVKKLLNWRKGASVIHHGKTLHYLPEQGVYTYFRYDQSHIVMVMLSKNNAPVELNTDRFNEILKLQTDAHRMAKNVLTDATLDISRSITVPARSALILEIQ